jgi:Peptidase inhibitor family I36
MTRVVVWFARGLLAILILTSPVLAQQWGTGPVPREGVCFYRDADFRGEYFCASRGETLSRVPSDMNDRISSIRIFGRVEVTVFKDREFDGRSTRFNSDVRDLADEGWNDRISSIRVRGFGYGGGGGNGGWYGRPGDVERIIRRAYQDILRREPDQEGLRVYRSHMIDDGWSEAQVREELRNSPEYRELNTMTYPKAQDIVRRAYLTVLKREPDAGSRDYVDKVMREHWTQADVERELRKSPEYRNKR